MRLNLSGVKHAQSWSEIGDYRAIRRLETPGFWAFWRLGPVWAKVGWPVQGSEPHGRMTAPVIGAVHGWASPKRVHYPSDAHFSPLCRKRDSVSVYRST